MSKWEFITFQRCTHYYTCDSAVSELYNATYVSFGDGVIVCKVKDRDTAWFNTGRYNEGALPFADSEVIQYTGQSLLKHTVNKQDQEATFYKPKRLVLLTSPGRPGKLYWVIDTLPVYWKHVIDALPSGGSNISPKLKRNVNQHLANIRTAIDASIGMPLTSFTPCFWIKADDKRALISVTDIRSKKHPGVNGLYSLIANLPEMDSLQLMFPGNSIKIYGGTSLNDGLEAGPGKGEDMYMPAFIFYVDQVSQHISISTFFLSYKDTILPIEQWRRKPYYYSFDAVVTGL